MAQFPLIFFHLVSLGGVVVSVRLNLLQRNLADVVQRLE